MNIKDYMMISKELNGCPKCGHDVLGTDEETKEFHGALIVEENLFTRKCRCGFEVTLDSNLELNKNKIKKEIEKALETL